MQISSGVDGDSLWLEVKDNGVGLSGQARTQFNNGVGLSNTRDRLECLYADAHRIEFSEGEGGLAVRLVLPLRRFAIQATPAVRVA